MQQSSGDVQSSHPKTNPSPSPKVAAKPRRPCMFWAAALVENGGRFGDCVSFGCAGGGLHWDFRGTKQTDLHDLYVCVVVWVDCWCGLRCCMSRAFLLLLNPISRSRSRSNNNPTHCGGTTNRAPFVRRQRQDTVFSKRTHPPIVPYLPYFNNNVQNCAHTRRLFYSLTPRLFSIQRGKGSNERLSSGSGHDRNVRGL